MNTPNDEIISLLKAFGDDIYLVGGTVRDYYIDSNIVSYDKDIIVTSCTSKEFGEKLLNKHNGTLILLDEKNEIYRFIFEDKLNYIDITTPTGNSIEEDLSRRDFTINAIAIFLKTSEVIDLYNGLNDIRNKRIVHISEQNFIDDPLRLLRAYRFQAITGFEIDRTTSEIIKKNSKLITTSAKERINYELLKLFGGRYADKSLLNSDEAGLLEQLFPMIIEEKKVPKNSHHHLDLFHHSIETVRQVEEIYRSSKLEIKTHLDDCDFGGASRLAHLKLAAFLHDIGKFSTWTIEPDGRHRFIMHDDVGAKLAQDYLKKNKYSKKQIEYVVEMIKKHIYPSAVAMGATGATGVTGVTSENGINHKSYMKYIRKMGNNSIDAIILSKADRLSARGKAITEDMVRTNLEQLDNLSNYYLSVKDTLKPLPKLLSGEEIMNLKHISPSKQLGEIIAKLQEAQVSGDITTKEEAINFLLESV